MYRELVTCAGSNILLIFRYVSQTGGASFFTPLSATPDVAEQFEIRGHILTGVKPRGEGSRVERVFFQGVVEKTLASLPLTLKNSGRPSCHQHFGQPK